MEGIVDERTHIVIEPLHDNQGNALMALKGSNVNLEEEQSR